MASRARAPSGSRTTSGDATAPETSTSNTTAVGDLSQTTLAHSSGSANTSGAVSNASYAGILLGERLPAAVTITRVEVTFATYGHGGWFGTTGPGPSTTSSASAPS